MSSPLRIHHPMTPRHVTITRPTTTTRVQQPSRRMLLAQFIGTGVNTAHTAIKTRSDNIRGAAFTELLRRLADCKVRKLGRKLSKTEVNGMMNGVTAVMMALQQTPRSANVNKMTSRFLEALCK